MKIRTFKSPQEYGATLKKMEALVEKIIAGKAEEEIWLLEHENVYTAGTSADDKELLTDDLPVFKVGRGGKHTYHGPGQRVIYLMLDMKKHYKTPDLKKFVYDLEQWVIDSLAEVGVEAYRKKGMIGIWAKERVVEHKKLPLFLEGRGQILLANAESLENLGEGDSSRTPHPNPLPQGAKESFNERKIAAIGIRVRKWISFHGISINIDPELENYNGIVPCGISEFGVTSLERLGKKISMKKIDEILVRNNPFR